MNSTNTNLTTHIYVFIVLSKFSLTFSKFLTKRHSIPNFPKIFILDNQILDLIFINKNHSSINFQRKNFKGREIQKFWFIQNSFIQNRWMNSIIYLELCQTFCRAVKTLKHDTRGGGMWERGCCDNYRCLRNLSRSENWLRAV